MTKEQMIELIATKCMHYNGIHVPWMWYNEDLNPVCYKEHYDPPTNISQAIDALEKFCDDYGGRYSIEKTEYYHCTIYTDADTFHGEHDTNLSEAISLAICEAIGGKG